MAIKRLDHVNFVTLAPEETVNFYCQLIGLTLGDHLSIDTSQSLYFYIPGQDVAILHVGNAKSKKVQPKFERLAELHPQHQGEFSTGSFDHFCLAIDTEDYDGFIEKIENRGLAYKTWCHEDIVLKQIWLLDPNGVRVELNFI
ncbi:MAG: VOC family protein [Legionella sp.]|nr:VOC family protein [Legionella sp.]